MSITAIFQKINLFNYFQRFVTSKYSVSKFFSKDSKDEENEKDRRFNITTGAARENKDTAKEESFFYKQSIEQLRALKEKFFGEKTDQVPKKKDSDGHH